MTQLFDFTEIPADGDRWMLFAQDFLRQFGFRIEPVSAHETDNVNDFVAVETTEGAFGKISFRWLVSCRHKASTRTGVKEIDESNLLERVLRNKADGFLGFYSTPATQALQEILREYKEKKLLKGFRLIDPKYLESRLTSREFSRLVLRFFPKYSQIHRPIVPIADDYLPLICENCGKDLLESLFSDNHPGVIVKLCRPKEDPGDMDAIHDIYIACKGECDEQLQNKHCSATGLNAASWVNLTDLVSPPLYLGYILSILEQMADDRTVYTPSAMEKETHLIRAMAQRCLREPIEEEILLARKKNLNG